MVFTTATVTLWTDDEVSAEFLEVVGMADKTNSLTTALQIPVDPEFALG
jgi:hypothetical protein